MKFVGLDLTDLHPRTPRPIDVAVLAPDRTIAFTRLPWADGDGDRVRTTAAAIRQRWPPAEHALALDGPQALAQPGRTRRECERLTRTPARTPDTLPAADRRPFAGYVRGSVLLWRALIADGWSVAESPAALIAGAMAEAYPGDAWRRLAGRRLPSKATVDGRAARFDLLRGLGLRFPDTPNLPDHDQLDAALCAALGQWAVTGEVEVEWVGMPLEKGEREGFILSPLRTVEIATPPAPLPAAHLVSRRPSPARSAAARRANARRPWSASNLDPGEVWAYFATEAQVGQAGTFEVAESENVLWRPARNSKGQAVANLLRIRPGDPIVLVHGDRMLAATLGTADGQDLVALEGFPACVASVESERLRNAIETAGFEPRRPMTVLVIEDVRDVPRSRRRRSRRSRPSADRAPAAGPPRLAGRSPAGGASPGDGGGPALPRARESIVNRAGSPSHTPSGCSRNCSRRSPGSRGSRRRRTRCRRPLPEVQTAACRIRRTRC